VLALPEGSCMHVCASQTQTGELWV